MLVQNKNAALTGCEAIRNKLNPAGAMLLAALAACSPHDEQGQQGMPPAQVTVVTVQPQRVPLILEYTGQVAGYRDVEVRARVTGILLKRHYQEGSRVRAGQALFRIDPAPFQAALDKARAELARAEAELERSQRDAARLKPLHEARAVSQKEYDDAVSAKQVAQAQVQAARSQVTQARLDLGYTRVESPISGLSSRAMKSEGSLVSGAEATLLTTVSQVDPIYVLFGVPDGEQLKLEREAALGRLVLPRDGLFQASVKLADGGSIRKPAGSTSATTASTPRPVPWKAVPSWPTPKPGFCPASSCACCFPVPSGQPPCWCRSARCSRDPRANSSMSSMPRARPSPGRCRPAIGCTINGSSLLACNPEIA